MGLKVIGVNPHKRSHRGGARRQRTRANTSEASVVEAVDGGHVWAWRGFDTAAWAGTESCAASRLFSMTWELVGRAGELARARTLVETGTGVAPVGPAGVGRSRLLEEILDSVEAATLPTLRVTATEATRSIPFAPLATLVPTAGVGPAGGLP